MDVVEIQKFIDYKTLFDFDVQFLVDKIKKSASMYLPQEQLEGIQKAYEFSKKAHGDQKRLSGEPYIVHPVRATIFLMDIKPDLATIQTCILHDVLEDTPVTYDEILKEFGQDVANLCEGLVKVAKVRYQGEERHIETLKKMFLAMGKDIRVIFVKLVDRIHNIQTLHFHPQKEKRERIALETMKIYVPIAKRLGLYNYQVLLETGAFRNLYPDDFETVFDYLKKLYGEGSKFKDRGVKMLGMILKRAGIPYVDIKGRIKSIYRIYQKLEDKYKTKDLSKVMDILAFRIVTNSVSDCYNILGVIHAHFVPLIKKIKDYIALPKPNGYKSIHTTVLGMFSFPVEIQIRTKEMDEVAEHGVVAHFAYSEENASVSITESQSQWIKKLQDIVKQYTDIDDKESFKDTLNIELLNQNIFVYTPQGDVIELPLGSTVLDFAFRIHTDIGLKYKNAFVSGSMVAINYALKTGDIVKINTYKDKFTASTFREDFLHTPSARHALSNFLNRQERVHYIQKTISKLNAKLKEMKLPLLYSKEDLISGKYSEDQLEDVLLKLAHKQISISTFVKESYPKHSFVKETKKAQKLVENIGIEESKKEVIVDNFPGLAYVFCPLCKPQQGDRIIAKSGKEGIKIHRLDCKGLSHVNYEKLLEAHWKDTPTGEYSLDMEMMIDPKPTVLLHILQVFANFHSQVDGVEFRKNPGEKTDIVKIVSHYTNPSKIQFILNDLKSVPGFVKIAKKKLV